MTDTVSSSPQPSYPARGDFEQLAQNHAVVPLWCELWADTLTPVGVYANLAGRYKGQGSYLLESVTGGDRWSRYSFVGLSSQVLLRAAGSRIERLERGEQGSLVPSHSQSDDSWQSLREELAQWSAPSLDELTQVGADPATWPRFWGGAVGYIAYDMVKHFEPTIVRDTANVHARAETNAQEYDYCLAFGGTLLVFDSTRQTVRVVVTRRRSSQQPWQEYYEEVRTELARVVGELQGVQNPSDPSSSEARVRPTMVGPRDDTSPGVPPSSFSRQEFCHAVQRAKEYIRAGDIFQVVLSQRFEVPHRVDAFQAYRAMRTVNPSPYMFFLDFPDTRIAGASPETLVHLEQGVARVRPIAGTRPRGATPEEDVALEKELMEDPKEVAEHVMLVDLGRNDIGRISESGTVEIEERMVVERYSHVMHIVSQVKGKLRQGMDALDVLQATFPTGTLSGAPKVRAMQIIDELEPTRRGVYGGAVGYIGLDGNMDVAIAIRTLVERNGAVTLQAGAGIVEASVPEKEYEETLNKARAALIAIERAAQL